MADFDCAALDAVEQRFWRDIWSSTDSGTTAERGLEVGRFGPVQATRVTGLPRARMLNLVLGAAEPGAVEGGNLAEAIAWMDAAGVDYYVPVSPLSGEEAATDWLKRAGLVRGYAWMKFVRDASPPEPTAPDDVEVRELAEGEGAAFGAIAASGFGLPEWAAAFFRDLPGRRGWRCYVALVDGTEAGCAALLVDGDVAEFGIAATLEAARGRGCQQALLRRRVEDAAAAGCRTLFVETGERVDGRPSNSYRNILRAGFEEAYRRPNWQRPAPGVGS